MQIEFYYEYQEGQKPRWDILHVTVPHKVAMKSDMDAMIWADKKAIQELKKLKVNATFIGGA